MKGYSVSIVGQNDGYCGMSAENIKLCISPKTNQFNTVASRLSDGGDDSESAPQEISFEQWNESVVRVFAAEINHSMAAEASGRANLSSLSVDAVVRQVVEYFRRRDDFERFLTHFLSVFCAIFAFLFSAWWLGLPFWLAFLYTLKYGAFLLASGVTFLVVVSMFRKARNPRKLLVQRAMWFFAALILVYEVCLLAQVVLGMG